MPAKKKIVAKVKKAAPKKVTKKSTKKGKVVLPKSLNDIDVAFILDVTGSMGPYIAEAKRMVAAILKKLKEENDVDIRVALAVYRDHPPQDSTLISKGHDFVDIDKFDAIISPYEALGGGDWPEAVYDGINEVMQFSWREGSDRAVYLIGDAPPHKQCKCGLTPKKLIEQLKKLKIEVNAHSIANNHETTNAFKEFVDATSGTISTGNRPEDMTRLYTESITLKSDDIATARVFASNVAAAGYSYTTAAALSEADIEYIADSTGMSRGSAMRAVTYLNKREM